MIKGDILEVFIFRQLLGDSMIIVIDKSWSKVNYNLVDNCQILIFSYIYFISLKQPH